MRHSARKKPTFAAAMAVGLCVATAPAESSFRVYGYLDAQAGKFWLDEQHPMRLVGFTDDFQATLSHVNTYFDWQPTDRSRVLVEANLNPQPSFLQEPGARAVLDERMTQEALAQAIRPMVDNAIRQKVLENPVLAGLPEAVRTHIADSVVQVEGGPTSQAQAAGILAQFPQEQRAYAAMRRDSYFFLERAQADLLFSDALNLRVGRFITPAGVWNVDHGSPVILTIKQPYQFDVLPIFPTRQEGAMLFGRMYLGDDDIDYSAYLSTGRQPPITGRQSIDALDDLGIGGRVAYHPGALSGSHIGLSGYAGRMEEYTYYANIPVLGIDPVTGQPTTAALEDWTYTRQDTIYVREFVAGTDAVLRLGKARLQGEFNYRLLRDDNGSGETGHYLGWYAIGSYDVALPKDRTLTPYAMYEQLTTDNLENIPGDLIGQTFVAGFRSVSLGVNLALASNVRLKLEYDYGRIIPRAAAGTAMANDLTESDLALQAVQSQLSVAF